MMLKYLFILDVKEEENLNFFQKLWAALVDLYSRYSSFIHSILPDQAGDLLEYLIDIAVAVAILKLASTFAFGSREN